MASLSVISAKFTEETLLEIVQKYHPGSSVKSWELDTCSNRGSSYLSEVNRLKVTGQVEGKDDFVVNCIVKSLPRSWARRQTFRSVEFFHQEIEFYDKIWAGFEDFQKRHNIPNPYNEIPRYLATFENGENDFIAMEDLGVFGFRSADRQVELDVPHCKLALSSLGKFHGISHAMRELEPDLFQRLTSHMVDIYYSEEAREWYKDIVKKQIHVSQDAVQREYPGSMIEKKFLQFTDNSSDFYSRMIGMTHAINEFSVIGHGDCWLPNFMFNYQGSTPERVKIIDFQLVRLGSCILDFSFFLYSCTTDQLRTKHYEEMLEWYYGGVEDTLRQFSLSAEKLFPKSVFQEELKKFSKFGTGMAMEALPLSIMDEEETTDLDTIEGDQPIPITEVWKIKPIETQEGRRRIADVFKHAVEQGYL